MSTNYSPTIVTDGAAFVGDALMPSISEPGTRVYNRAGVDSADVKLLVHGNVGSGQSFSDSSLSNHTITVAGNVTHSTTQSKFNGGSIYFDGTGDYLSVADSADWTFGTGDFTIDLWIYPTTIGSGGNKNYIGTNPNQYLTFASNNSGGLLFYYGNGTWTSTPAATSNVVVNNIWQHVAVSRSGGTVYLFCNGVLMTSRTQSASIDPPNIEIGAYGGGASDLFVGYMDEVRITKGAALWTKGFTPPARRDTLSISDGMMYNGSCLNFDGTDEYVLTSGYFGALAGDDAVTLCAWINVDTTGNMGIISIGNVYMSIIVNGGYLEARCYDAGSVLTNTDAHQIVPNVWCHVAGVFSGGNVTLYKDGVATAAVACSNQNIAESATYFQLGKGYASGYLWMDGEIASPMAFDTALSASQIKEIYQDSKVIIPSNVSQTNLKGFWTFAEGAGDICYDGSGRGIHGEFQNMESADWSTGQTGAPQLVEGYNRAMLFDGSNDYVQLASDISLASDYTIAFWILKHDVGSTGWKGLVSTDYTPRSITIEWYENTDYISAFTSNDGSNWNGGQLSTSTGLNANQWYHVAFKGTGGAGTLYLDGSVVSTGTAADPIYNSTFETPVFGRYGSGQNCACILNEVVIYNAAISAGDVQALAATDPNGGPLPADPTTLGSSGDIVGYWRNDQNVTWADRVGSNTGTVNGSPDVLLFKQGINGSASTSTGRDNQGFPLKYKDVGAVGFNGSDNLIEIPHSTVFNSTVFSYCSWVYVPGDTTADGKVAHLSNNSAGNGWATWQIRSSTTTNQLYYQTNNAGTWQTYTMNNYFTGAGWYYICVTHIQGSNPTVYRNAEVFAGTGTVSQNFDFGTDPLYIGCRKSASSFIEFWNGQIANGQYYNRLLSQAEIKQNYNAQKGRFT